MASTTFDPDLHPRANAGKFVNAVPSPSAVSLAGENPQPYVIVRGGLVDNDPTLPVIDLDFLDGGTVDPDEIAYAQGVYKAAAALGLSDVVGRIDRWAADQPLWTRPKFQISPVRANDDSFVLLEGGIVQNSPSIPVYDLDFSDSDDRETAESYLAEFTQMGRGDLADEVRAFLR